MMKHFPPDGSDLFQHEPTPIHPVSEYINKYVNKDENDVNHMPWSLQSPDLKQIVHPIRQRFLPSLL